MRLAIVALLSGALVAMPALAQRLAGVSDRETTIPNAGRGGITALVFGRGDVMFVRDRRNKWYRVALNSGCFKHRKSDMGADQTRFLIGYDGTFDRMSMIRTRSAGPCAVTSIRRSLAPPQVDRRSPVTLD